MSAQGDPENTDGPRAAARPVEDDHTTPAHDTGDAGLPAREAAPAGVDPADLDLLHRAREVAQARATALGTTYDGGPILLLVDELHQAFGRAAGGDQAPEADEDVAAMAEHVLRTRAIDHTRYGWRGIGEFAARRAVEALAAAGLLAERPRRDVPAELTPDRAELLVRRGLAAGLDKIVVAETGVLRLEWSGAAYRLTDHTGEYFRGTDHVEAAAAFNRVARRDVAETV